MKKIIVILFLLSGLIVKSQGVDSSKLMVGKFTVQARDIESIRFILGTRDVWDDYLDSVNVKFRKNPKPQGNDPVTVDSVVTQALIALSQWMRAQDYEDVSIFYTRIDAAIKAVPSSPYLQRMIGVFDAAMTNRNQNVRQDGRKRLLGKQ